MPSYAAWSERGSNHIGFEKNQSNNLAIAFINMEHFLSRMPAAILKPSLRWQLTVAANYTFFASSNLLFRELEWHGRGKKRGKGEIFGDFSTFIAQLKGKFSEMRDFFTFFFVGGGFVKNAICRPDETNCRRQERNQLLKLLYFSSQNFLIIF